jgi:hypothetical protein
VVASPVLNLFLVPVDAKQRLPAQLHGESCASVDASAAVLSSWTTVQQVCSDSGVCCSSIHVSFKTALPTLTLAVTRALMVILACDHSIAVQQFRYCPGWRTFQKWLRAGCNSNSTVHKGCRGKSGAAEGCQPISNVSAPQMRSMPLGRSRCLCSCAHVFIHVQLIGGAVGCARCGRGI